MFILSRLNPFMKHQVAIIGSGNFGTAIAKLVAENVANNPNYDSQVLMWTFEEMIEDQKLTDIINTKNENVKYLPSVKLPTNLVACANLEICLKSDVLVFVVPHQFITKIVKDIKQKTEKKIHVISLIKGVIFENNNLSLISDFISKELGCKCGVLMGANIASQIGNNIISEGTLACNDSDKRIFMDIFNCYKYRVLYINDIAGVELCGTLKNIVSLAYGISIGLGYETNTSVAILRNGFKEMVKFCQMFFKVKIETFFESCGIADLIVSSLSGRNFKCGNKLATGMSIENIEEEMGGQKLQGTITAKEVYEFLKHKGKESEFPLFVTVYKICYENESSDAILETISYECGANK